MPEKPDFIVDPSGNVRDARAQNNSQASQFSSQPPVSGSSPPGRVGNSGPTQRTPGGIILIPIGLIITIVIAVFRLAGGQSQKNTYPESDVDTLNTGLHYYDQGDYMMALAHFNMVIASQPKMGEAYNDRGLTYLAMGETDKALADFNQAVQLMPNPAVPYSNRGGLHLFQGEHALALTDLDKAIELSPSLAKAYHNRGLTYLDLGDYDHAIADFDRAIELTPETMFSMQATMESRNPEGDRLLGSGFFTSLLDSQTYADLPTTYASRAMAYLQKGDYARAAADLEKAAGLGYDPGLAQQLGALQPGSNSAPRPGHWQGSGELVGIPGAIAFDIGADGQIQSFTLDLDYWGSGPCRVVSDFVFVQPDGAFSFTFDGPGIEIGISTQGRFESSTTAAGSFSGYVECITSTGEHMGGGMLNGDTWSAQWVGETGETPSGDINFK
jgi:Tfp pilus assembly protein PilF